MGLSFCPKHEDGASLREIFTSSKGIAPEISRSGAKFGTTETARMVGRTPAFTCQTTDSVTLE